MREVRSLGPRIIQDLFYHRNTCKAGEIRSLNAYNKCSVSLLNILFKHHINKYIYIYIYINLMAIL